eukprot:6071048-Pleurochrysis_carterae.AAC.1
MKPYSNVVLAKSCNVSVKRVKNHFFQLFAILNASSQEKREGREGARGRKRARGQEGAGSIIGRYLGRYGVRTSGRNDKRARAQEHRCKLEEAMRGRAREGERERGR